MPNNSNTGLKSIMSSEAGGTCTHRTPPATSMANAPPICHLLPLTDWPGVLALGVASAPVGTDGTLCCPPHAWLQMPSSRPRANVEYRARGLNICHEVWRPRPQRANKLRSGSATTSVSQAPPISLTQRSVTSRMACDTAMHVSSGRSSESAASERNVFSATGSCQYMNKRATGCVSTCKDRRTGGERRQEPASIVAN